MTQEFFNNAGQFLAAHAVEVNAIILFLLAAVEVFKLFQGGLKDKALEQAKLESAKLADALVPNDEKLERAVEAVYDALSFALEKWIKLPAIARTIILFLLPKKMVVTQVKLAWHLYVKPLVKDRAVEPPAPSVQ